MTVYRFFKMVCMAGVLLSTVACGSHAHEAAPLGDKAALEKLAKAYRMVEESQQMDSSPMSLVPDKRKKFIEMVFEKAEYNYSATLHSLAEGMTGNTLKVIDQNIKDLAELLLLPHRGSAVAMEDLYSTQELQDIRAIESRLK